MYHHSGKMDSLSPANHPDYCQVLRVKDTNGQIKELVFPKALDLNRPKRPRTTFSSEQLKTLESRFAVSPYLIGKERSALAVELGLSETQIKVWFQNRRTKTKRDYSEASQTSPTPTKDSSSSPGSGSGGIWRPIDTEDHNDDHSPPLKSPKIIEDFDDDDDIVVTPPEGPGASLYTSPPLLISFCAQMTAAGQGPPPGAMTAGIWGAPGIYGGAFGQFGGYASGQGF